MLCAKKIKITKFVFTIDMKSQKTLGQSDKRSRSNSPSLEKVVLFKQEQAGPELGQAQYKLAI